MPNQEHWCAFWVGEFKDSYPSRSTKFGDFFGSGPCINSYPYYSMDMSQISSYYTDNIGEYDFYISYCGGDYDTYWNNKCGYGGIKAAPFGRYYRMYFNGSVWSPISGSDTTIKFNTVAYTLEGLKIKVPFGTIKNDFLPHLVLPTGSTINSDNIHDLLLSGDTLVIVSGDGSLMATYTIFVGLDPLPPAKALAHDVLAAKLLEYKNSDYTVDNWIILNKFKTDGDIAIDSAIDLVGVILAQNTASDGMAGVPAILKISEPDGSEQASPNPTELNPSEPSPTEQDTQN